MNTTASSPSSIEGVTLTMLRQIVDVRGAVLHMLRCDTPEFTRFGECYFSELVPGAVKAWKRHRAQTQNIAVPVGRIRMVIYDERAHSASFGRLLELELGRPDAYLRLRIPPLLWYGFACMGDRPAMLVNCADIPYDPDESDVRPVDHPSIPYEWQRTS